MKPKRSVPPPPPLVRQTADMDTTPDEVKKPTNAIEGDELVSKEAIDEFAGKKKTKRRNYDEWYNHVNKVKEDNPGIAHSDAVRKAKETYKKTPKVKRDTTGHKRNPWMDHIKAWMGGNPEWRKEYSYKDVLKKAKETYNSASPKQTL